MSSPLSRQLASAMRAPALGRAASSDKILHFENTVLTATPFSGFAARRPRVFMLLYFSALGTGFVAPFIVMQYQLAKQKKHLFWSDPEDI